MSWGRETGTRPSGKAFSFRLTDAERARLQAAVDEKNRNMRSIYLVPMTIGAYVKCAALARATQDLAIGRTAAAATQAAAAGGRTESAGSKVRPLSSKVRPRGR